MSLDMDVDKQKNNPLHGITLETIVTKLVDAYGWEDLAIAVPINCFKDNPSINSSLKFLRKTPWARAKLESFFLYAVRKGKCTI
jgi:uncharacterized protein (DUF2132 family)